MFAINKKITTFFSVLTLAWNGIYSESPDSKLTDLHSVYHIFNSYYAPKEWKETHLRWDIDKELTEAENKITNTPRCTVKDFQIIVRDFVRSTQDYHVSCSIESTEKATLPFSVKGVNGRYFLRNVDKKQLDRHIFKIKVGDELLALNDRPIAEIAQEILSQTSLGVVDTDEALASEILTVRGKKLGLQVPKGPVMVTFRDRDTQEIKTYQMVWRYQPEYFSFHRDVVNPQKKSLIASPKMAAADWIASLGEGKSKPLVGGKRSDLPKLGTVICKNDSDAIFQAYIFRTEEGQHVGFLRIPTYYPEEGYSEALEGLAEILKMMEEDTSCLVIDQRNNPGGMVFYSYAIASMFATKPLKTPHHSVMMTPKFIAEVKKNYEAIKSVETKEDAEDLFSDTALLSDAPMHSLQMINEFYEFLILEWNLGKNLSDPYFFYGIDRINPHREIVYTKPVLLLVNELDFSCADFFPAIMQDNGRAVLMGNRTSGAGGAVNSVRIPSKNGVSGVSYTWTIAQRPDGAGPIENLGVTPDIFYKDTEEDLQMGYQPYKEAILSAVQKILASINEGEKIADDIVDDMSRDGES